MNNTLPNPCVLSHSIRICNVKGWCLVEVDLAPPDSTKKALIHVNTFNAEARTEIRFRRLKLPTLRPERCSDVGPSTEYRGTHSYSLQYPQRCPINTVSIQTLCPLRNESLAISISRDRQPGSLPSEWPRKVTIPSSVKKLSSINFRLHTFPQFLSTITTNSIFFEHLTIPFFLLPLLFLPSRVSSA